MEIIVFETRLEGIIFTPLIQAISKTEELDCVFVITKQHYEMLDQVLLFFSISPTYKLIRHIKRKTPFIEKNRYRIPKSSM